MISVSNMKVIAICAVLLVFGVLAEGDPEAGRGDGHIARFGEECPPGVPVALCLREPCGTASCPTFATAKCRPNYCGGCFADFYDQSGNLVPECSESLVHA